MIIAPISVITPTIPGRAFMLQQAMTSVQDQTLLPLDHVVIVDSGHAIGEPWGPAHIRNMAIQATKQSYVAFLDDDDVLDNVHLDVLAHVLVEHDADLAYSFCRFDGPEINPIFVNQVYDRETLREHGIFPITVLVNRSSLLDCGGFNEEDQYEDWALWNRMADNGCRFACVPEVTWTYRTGHESRTKQAMEGRR
jgi:type III secretory pathway component EscS